MNDRHRQLGKFWDGQKCPACKTPIYTQRWYEDYWGCVESYTKCEKCGYTDHTSYGSAELSIGKKAYYFGHSTPSEEVEKIFKKFKTAIKRFRRGSKKYA